MTESESAIQQTPIPYASRLPQCALAPEIIAHYKNQTNQVDALFETRKQFLAEKGRIPQLRQMLIRRSQIIDRALKHLWKLYGLDSYEDIALFAVGGYGRREVFPASDIDILILHHHPLHEEQQARLESFVQTLWDLGTPIGQSVRLVSECLALAASDHTILANLLNHRKIVVSSNSFSMELKTKLRTSSVSSSDDFFHQKRQEYLSRHSKHADTEYNLEPNIKEAPGGLRDIHALMWITQYTLGTGSLAKLMQLQILSQEELTLLQNGYDFIASIRYCLHVMVGRDENRLLFDYQKKLASELGFTGDHRTQAVEQFMKTYYRHASTIAAIVDMLLENIEEEVINTSQVLQAPINERFMLMGNKIAVRHDKVFQDTPFAVLELFYLLGQSPAELGVRANTIRLLRQARHIIDDRFRHDPMNNALFLQILQSPYRLFTQLKRMKRYGILGRYLPEFGHVIGQMQYDLFHVYTVDAHALLVVQNMRLLRHAQARQTFPLASKIIHGLANRTLLYIAGLFHDIAKGRGGDHSILGADDVEKFCRRHQLTEADTQLITWLVLDHLIMSVTAQKMDISDYRVIEEFARKVGDQERLDYLYLLTICDIGATNPKLLNPWRLSLLNQLYMETAQVFKRSLAPSAHWAGRAARIRSKANELLREKGTHETAYAQLWASFGEDYFGKYSAEDIAWHTEAILQHKLPQQPLVIIGLTQESTTQVYTQIFIYMRDCPYLFVNSVATLSELGLNILDARILTSKAGHTLNTFIVDDDNTGIIANTPQIYRKICETMTERLAHSSSIPTLSAPNIPRRHKHFEIKTLVRIHNRIDEPYAVIGIETLDRPGLLVLIGAALAKHQLSLHSAKILTFGERVEDFFYVSYQGERLYDRSICQSIIDDLLCTLEL